MKAVSVTASPLVRIATVLGLLAAPPAHASIVIEIDKSAQSMTVMVDGTRRWVWPVSTGRRGYATPEGSYKAFRMEEDHYSREWDEAPMPHSIFFTKKGHAIHGTFETRRLGTPASHGCVRLSTQNAAMLFTLVRQRGVTNTQVVVSGDEDFRQLAEPRRANPREHPSYQQARPRYQREPRYEREYGPPPWARPGPWGPYRH